MKLIEAKTSFLKYLKTRKNRSNDTITTYKSVINLFIRWSGDIEVSDLTPHLIDRYANWLQCQSLAPRTFRNRLTPIRSLVEYLYAKNYIDMRPESIDLPKVEGYEADFLQEEEQTALIKACRTKQERAIIKVLLSSGVRVSELVDIRREDVINRSVIIRSGKGSKPRLTFITSDARHAVLDFHAENECVSRYYISTRTGGRLTRQQVYRTINNVGFRAGLGDRVSPHTLRHTFATNMLSRGARVEEVQKLLGHSNIQTTLIYTHFTDVHLQKRYDEVLMALT